MNSENSSIDPGSQLVHQAGDIGGPVDPLVIIEKRNKLMDRLLEAALKSTDSSQWCDMQGKPFPTAAACEIMARRCGVRMFDVNPRREERSDEDGEYYIYFVSAKFQLGNSEYDILEAIGTCSSRDQFLGTETNKGRELKDVDEGNIMKAAYSNCIVNGVSRLLGVRNKTWEQLKQFGIEVNGAARINFAEGSRGGGQNKAATFPYGDNTKGKTPAEVTDADLVWWAKRLNDDLLKNDPDKAKYRPNNEKLLAAVKEEMAKRANAKAGTAANNDVKVTVWDRLKQFAAASGVSVDRLQALTKTALKQEKVLPGELSEADFKLVADEVETEKKRVESEKAAGAGGGDKANKAGF